jgi:glycosyltransferase involved in cell wall biosynthesis
MHGSLSQVEVGRLYRESDLLVDCSFWHGFGRMGLESMACGAVPVLSNSGGISEYAVHGENSLIFDVGDYNSAVEHLVRLACDFEYRFKLRTAALTTSAKFSEWSAVDDWLQLWRLSAPRTNLLRSSFDPSTEIKKEATASEEKLKIAAN